MSVECRICKEPNDDSENPLISPCMCVGTVGKVHQNCIAQWVKISNRNICTICNTEFSRHTEYNGPLPTSFVQNITKRGSLFSKMLLIGIFIYIIMTLSAATFRILWGYFIISPLTFTKLALYYAISYGIHVIMGLLFAIGREMTITLYIQNTQLRFEKLILPVSNILAVLEFIVASHHIVFTGWVFPVMIMYYVSIYNLVTTIIVNDFLGWYQRHYFKEIFINRLQ